MTNGTPGRKALFRGRRPQIPIERTERPDMEKVTTEWIERVLHAALTGSGRLNVLPKITPEGWWECDIFSTTGAGYWSEHEIKVSRADFKNDFTKTAHFKDGKMMKRKAGMRKGIPESFKHEMMTERCPLAPNYYWICSPEGLLLPEDIPEYAGWMEFPLPNSKNPSPYWGAYAKIAKKAPRLHGERISDHRMEKIAGQIPYRLQRAYFETIPKLKQIIAELKRRPPK